jgi:hypothetical protein
VHPVCHRLLTAGLLRGTRNGSVVAVLLVEASQGDDHDRTGATGLGLMRAPPRGCARAA